MKADSTTKTNYLDQLTWLRGIAAFLVIVSHTLRATEVKYTPTDNSSHSLIMSLLDLGSFGVVLFFVLSGCTLYISNSTKTTGKQVFGFYTKRFFRIWPAFAISLLLYLAFAFIFMKYYPNPSDHWVEGQFLTPYTLNDLVKYLSLVFDITGPSSLFNNAYWSLPVEFQYYIIFPIIVLTLEYGGIAGPAILSAILFLLPTLGLTSFNDVRFFTLAFSFSGGMIIGYLYKTYSFRIHHYMGLLIIALGFTLASCITNEFLTLPSFPIVNNSWNWFGLTAILMVAVVAFSNFKIHNLLKIILKKYGDISYSTYLLHNLFIAIAVLIIINFKIHDATLRLAGTFIFTLVCTYFAASISYKYIEVYFMNIGRNLSYKYFK